MTYVILFNILNHVQFRYFQNLFNRENKFFRNKTSKDIT